MKTIKQIIKQSPVFIGFEDAEDVQEQYMHYNTNENVKFAVYVCGDYEGDSWVLFEKHGELYEVNGSHCSCFGLEGQWEPEEISLKELENRLINGTAFEYYGADEIKDKLKEYLGMD